VFVNTIQEIVRCFTTEIGDNRLKPLTYQDIIQKKALNQTTSLHGTTTTSSSTTSTVPSTPDRRGGLVREHSIEKMTPGLGSGDGFIHTTLCRLPLDCLSQHDVSLNDVHRLCREMSEAMCGHRMVVSKFRFLETTGEGGQVSRTSMVPPYHVVVLKIRMIPLSFSHTYTFSPLFCDATVQSLCGTHL
jgi:hypothetical protein